jgi:hypothetical protein
MEMMLFQLELILSFHSYASRIGSKLFALALVLFQAFPFIRFTNWKQDFQEQLLQLAELQLQFPFIRFTNWKQGRATLPLPKLTLFPFIRFTNWKQADLQWEWDEEWNVSIHTLHELEASFPWKTDTYRSP